MIGIYYLSSKVLVPNRVIIIDSFLNFSNISHNLLKHLSMSAFYITPRCYVKPLIFLLIQ